MRCDSFVVETNVEFPTDTGLLFEAVRKALGLVAELSGAQGLPGWRQHRHHLRQFKKAQRGLRTLRHSSAQDEHQRQARQTAIEAAHRDYLEQATTLLERIHETRTPWLEQRVIPLGLAALDDYVQHAERQIDQIRRRVLRGEVIPHAEKVFSIFEPHTEWISKGKAGVPVELGLRVCVIEDQYRFILHHQVMEKTTDDQVAVPITTAAKTRFSAVQAISFDKGFHSPANQTELPALVGQVVLPRKGKRSAPRQAAEAAPDFVRLRRRHSAVESAINALESHGLDRCPDHGLDGFKRYVALAVVARNIQRLGAILQEQARRRRRGPYLKAA